MSHRVFNQHKHELNDLSEWVLEQNKAIYFYSYTGFEASLLIGSTKELKDDEIKIIIDAYLVTDNSDIINSDDYLIWEDGDDIDIDWLIM